MYTCRETERERLLGVSFDEEPAMAGAVAEIVSAARWNLNTLLRTRRYYTDTDLVVLRPTSLVFRIPHTSHLSCHPRRVM